VTRCVPRHRPLGGNHSFARRNRGANPFATTGETSPTERTSRIDRPRAEMNREMRANPSASTRHLHRAVDGVARDLRSKHRPRVPCAGCVGPEGRFDIRHVSGTITTGSSWFDKKTAGPTPRWKRSTKLHTTRPRVTKIAVIGHGGDGAQCRNSSRFPFGVAARPHAKSP